MRTERAEQCLSVLAAAARVGIVSVAVANLANRLRTHPGRLSGPLAELERDDLIETWTNDRQKPAAALTPWALGLFGIEVNGRLRRRRNPRQVLESDLSELDTLDGLGVVSLNQLPDDTDMLHGPEPDEIETNARYRWRRSDYMAHAIPKPRHLLGSSAPWPLPPVNGTCPTCRDAPPLNAYCLACHQYPLADRMLGKPEQAPPEEKARRARATERMKAWRAKKAAAARP